MAARRRCAPHLLSRQGCSIKQELLHDVHQLCGVIMLLLLLLHCHSKGQSDIWVEAANMGPTCPLKLRHREANSCTSALLKMSLNMCTGEAASPPTGRHLRLCSMAEVGGPGELPLTTSGGTSGVLCAPQGARQHC